MKQHPDISGVFIADHPLIQHKLSHLREKSCPKTQFRALLKEIAMLMTYEMTRDLPLTQRKIETPVATMDAPVLAPHDKPVIVPILRAGLGMLAGVEEMIPEASVGHIGLYRNETTHEPVEYLVRLPAPAGRHFILVDPMLATGGSAIYAVKSMVKHGVTADKIKFMALVASPEGVKAFKAAWAEIPVYVAAIDDYLNENAYIIQGLGDAGDRLFGTV
jgi:uracil phosphoribosyltransferase